MRKPNAPVYRIGVAAQLCEVHPQTLRQYERMGLISPAREGEKNRLYSDEDVERVRRIQRLTRDMGVNLAGVELILRLLDEMDTTRREMESQMAEYLEEMERRLASILQNPTAPVPRDVFNLPVPKIVIKRRVDI
ncbi:MAG: MerR family transcriptional regulator [Fimbriimonadales bacterium]